MILDLDHIAVTLNRKRILHDLCFSAKAGDFIGLVGPNGAGKSTFLKMAAGLLPIDNGTRRIEGDLLETLTPKDRARRFSYLPQARPVYWAMTARAVVALGRFAWGNPLTEDARDREAVDRALSLCGAAHLAERPANELSGGELSRIHLARALAGETPILLADEPAAALDPAHQLAVMALLRAMADEGKTVIAALHDLPLAARYCTRLAVMHGGRLAAEGAPSAVLTDALLRDVFNVSGTFSPGGALAIHPLTD